MSNRIIMIRENEIKVFEKACNIALRHGCELHGMVMVEPTPSGWCCFIQAMLYRDVNALGSNPDNAIACIRKDIEEMKKD